MKAIQHKSFAVSKAIAEALAEINDPEMPFISIVDLGILRKIEEKVIEGETVLNIILTPTFSSCPAMFEIKNRVESVIKNLNVIPKKKNIHVITELSPPWSSQDLTERGRRILVDNGIAVEDMGVLCPRCGSEDIESLSEFGSTRCKKYVRCQSCQEPFEVFKSYNANKYNNQ